MSEAGKPGAFDRSMDSFLDNQAAVHAGPAQKRLMGAFGLGAQMWIVQTFRIEGADTLFLECYGDAGQTRLVVPPEVTRIIARQYDALGGKSRSRAAKALAADRKERGIPPGFMKKKGG